MPIDKMYSRERVWCFRSGLCLHTVRVAPLVNHYLVPDPRYNLLAAVYNSQIIEKLYITNFVYVEGNWRAFREVKDGPSTVVVIEPKQSCVCFVL